MVLGAPPRPEGARQQGMTLWCFTAGVPGRAVAPFNHAPGLHPPRQVRWRGGGRAMTESEWLECDNPQPMLAFLAGKAKSRNGGSQDQETAAVLCRVLPSCLAMDAR